MLITFNVVVKMAPIGTRTQNCFSLVRRSVGLSIPGRDTYYMSCSVFICALRSFSQCHSITILVFSIENSKINKGVKLASNFNVLGAYGYDVAWFKNTGGARL